MKECRYCVCDILWGLNERAVVCEGDCAASVDMVPLQFRIWCLQCCEFVTMSGTLLMAAAFALKLGSTVAPVGAAEVEMHNLLPRRESFMV